MNEKPYRIVDDSAKNTRGVRIYDPEGVVDITNNAFQYVITRGVDQLPRVKIEVFGEPHVVDNEINKKWIEGAVVCEITQAKTANGN